MIIETGLTRRPLDDVHPRLTRAVERRQRSYLWTPKDMISFVPRVLPMIYGDGRALFRLTTINQRPAYWIIRCCSSWTSDLDFGDEAPDEAPDFGEFTDEILTDLEDAFGNGRCGYMGNSLFWPRRERMRNCQCEECSDTITAKWPMVDGHGGCSWSRMAWPEGFDTVTHGLAHETTILAAPTVSETMAMASA